MCFLVVFFVVKVVVFLFEIGLVFLFFFCLVIFKEDVIFFLFLLGKVFCFGIDVWVVVLDVVIVVFGCDIVVVLLLIFGFFLEWDGCFDIVEDVGVILVFVCVFKEVWWVFFCVVYFFVVV